MIYRRNYIDFTRRTDSKNMSSEQKKAALHNLGCKVNAYETDAMQQLLEEAGYIIVPFEERADVYVINTCSVTNIADRKSRQMLHRARKNNPDAIVVAAGCYVQTATPEVLEDDAVDIIIGNNQKNHLIDLLDAYAKQKQEPLVCCEDINRPEQEYEQMSVKKTAEHTRAFIKVQDGCNQFCSYCIIPYARGRVRSRSIADVVSEVEQLAAAGYREVVLTGIHLSSYGLQENYNAEPDGTHLLELIEAVNGIAGIDRIRLGSLEPQIVTEVFAKRLAQVDKLCPHFHLSLQSGCDATLQRMNRRYTTEEYGCGCEVLRRFFDCPAITTDVIVGFPGETEEEFATTKDYLASIGFYEMHIFKYSRRKGTKAADMPDQIPEPIKVRRSESLFALERQMSTAYRTSYVGRSVEALMETPLEKDGIQYYTGYTREYIRVALPTDADLSNCLVGGTLGDLVAENIYLLEQPVMR